MTEQEFLVWHARQGKVAQISGTIDYGVPLLDEAGRFLSGHAALPEGYDRIPRENINAMGELLLHGKAGISVKETIIMILAHHPSREALRILMQYNRCPDAGLKIFAEFALDECQWWNSQ